MNQPKLVAAQFMAQVVDNDAQFVLPARPRFPREFVTIAIPDGLLVEGGQERQVLRGRHATTLVPRLINMLDGSRSLVALCAALPDVSPDHMKAAVALLYSRGLLEDGAAGEGSAPGIHAEALAFMRRHVDNTRMNRSAEEAAVKLASSRVAVISDDSEAALALSAELNLVGVNSATPVDTVTEAAFAGHTLVVALNIGRLETDWLGQVDAVCAGLGVPWVRFALYGHTAELGPYLHPSEPRCYSCLAHCHGLHSRAVQTAPTWTKHAFIQLAATEIVYLLSWVSDPRTVNEVMAFDFHRWTGQTLTYARVPGCPRCLPGNFPEAEVTTPQVYEEGVDLPAKHLLSLKAHQTHYKVANQELQRPVRRFLNSQVIPLPRVEALPLLKGSLIQSKPVMSGECAPVGLDQVASVLLYTAGLRGQSPAGKPNRWAYNGGNLGSVELYLLTRDVSGLHAGLFGYLPSEHGLAILRTLSAVESAQLMQAIVMTNKELPSALLIASGAYLRMASKYFSLAYRLLHLDAGVALEQATTVGTAVGLHCQLQEFWNDTPLDRLLELDGIAEVVTGLVSLSGGGRCLDASGI